MSTAKAVDARSGSAWIDDLVGDDVPASPLARRADHIRPQQLPADQILALRSEWRGLHVDDLIATMHLRDIGKGTQRYENALERIVRRRERMLEIVNEAVKVPVPGPVTRDQLQRFADMIETSGSVHDDADLLLIEARIAETEPKPAPPATPKKSAEKAKTPAALRGPAGGA